MTGLVVALDRNTHRLLDKQVDAIKRATTLLSQYQNPDPEKDCPSTTVHKLVMELNKWNK